MIAAGTSLRRALALGAACAAAVAGASSTPAPQPWSPDPDEQFLLDVKLKQLRLPGEVRAYNTPEGTCVLLGDFLTALDVPMKIDLGSRRATGWAFREEHRISIDAAAGQVTYGSKSEAIAPHAIRDTSEGWCVDSAAMSRWFAIGVKPMTSASTLMLESEAKLPVELAIERQQRAAQVKPAKFDLRTLPQVRLPYRVWRAPALDFVVSAGVTYRASDGVKVDRSSTVRAAGEIARLSYDAQLSTTEKGLPAALRVRAYRSDPEGGLLGPLKATHFGAGDVEGLDSRLGGSGTAGRGAIVTNRPLFNPATFDRTRFQGDLPAGWEAEIYRNGELLAFARPTADQRYVFDDVQLMYGENRISIVLYGPQGQVRTRDELINVGRDNVPAGKTWYWAGANQPGRDILSFREEPDAPAQPKFQAAASVEHGIDERTSVGALARTMLLEDERVTFVEGSVRRSFGRAMVEVAVARDSAGGSAARAQALAKIGQVNVSADALVASDFRLSGGRERSVRDFKLALDAPLRIGRRVVPAHADVRFVQQGDGSSQLEAAARLSTQIERFNLASDFRYRRHFSAHGPDPPGELEVAAMGSGRVGQVRLRGFASAEVVPQARFRSAELSAYWSASDHADWEGALAWDSLGRRARARVSHIRRFDTLALGLTAEAATDGALAGGFSLNFSLDPGQGLRLSRQLLAGAGAIRARVYRDLNDNGLRDPSEPLEQGAQITTGTRTIEKPTGADGSVLVGGLTTFVPVPVGIDTLSLSDPMLVPKKALQVVVPRPGIAAEVEIGLVGGGEIEGVVVKSGGVPFEGLALELVDASGKVAATVTSDFDGFFLFERVPYGRYKLRVAEESAAAAKVGVELNVTAEVSEDKAVARLGTIDVQPLPRIASIE